MRKLVSHYGLSRRSEFLILNLCAVWRIMVNATDPTGVENIKSLALTGVSTPNRPLLSESQYRLRYSGSDPEDEGSKFIRRFSNGMKLKRFIMWKTT